MITKEQARESLQRFVSGCFKNGDRPRIGIPARPDYDDDLILSTYIDEAEARIAALEAMLARTAEGYAAAVDIIENQSDVAKFQRRGIAKSKSTIAKTSELIAKHEVGK